MHVGDCWSLGATRHVLTRVCHCAPQLVTVCGPSAQAAEAPDPKVMAEAVPLTVCGL